jgi:hypothetical protein
MSYHLLHFNRLLRIFLCLACLMAPALQFHQDVVASPAYLTFSGFLGGSDHDQANAIAVDEQGYIYIAGSTQSKDFPATLGAYRTTLAQQDAFVAKLDPDSGAIIYATLIGGSSLDAAWSLAVQGGVAYLTGETHSTDFPTTPNAYDATCGGDGTCGSTAPSGPYSDAFFVAISPDGSRLAYSTYLGGQDADRGYGIATLNGQIYLTGITYSTDFPGDGYRRNGDVFVVNFTDQYQLVYSKLLGGSDVDAGFAVYPTRDGVYITGETSSLDFPPRSGYRGGRDVFITRLDSTGAVASSRLVGGTDDEMAYALSGDAAGNIYAAGITFSPDFPATQGTYNGGGDAFFLQIDPTGNVSLASYLGGSGADEARSIFNQETGNILIAGNTSSMNFPLAGAFLQSSNQGGREVFLSYFTHQPDSSVQMKASTYIGGSVDDMLQGLASSTGETAFLTGVTQSTDFPVQPGALSTTLNGTRDAFVLRWDLAGWISAPAVPTPTSQPSPTSTILAAVTATATKSSELNPTSTSLTGEIPSPTGGFPSQIEASPTLPPPGETLSTHEVSLVTSLPATQTAQIVATREQTAVAAAQTEETLAVAIPESTLTPGTQAPTTQGNKSVLLTVGIVTCLALLGIAAWWVWRQNKTSKPR